MFDNINKESFDIAVASKEEVIGYLECHIAWLERELENQRKRADLAIDRLLSIQKIPTVMPENIVFPSQADAKNISEQQKVMEAIKSEMESIGEIAEDERPTVVTEIQ